MSLLNMNGNILCAVDVETTGTLAGYHEIIQIACVPLNQHFEPHPDYRFFYLPGIMPDHPQRMEKEAAKKHKITVESLEGCVSESRAIELFEGWYQGLNLPFGKRLVPLAHNWAFERAFLIHWLGLASFDDKWYIHPRDTFTLAASINDFYVWHGRKHPFHQLSLVALCNRFDIQLDRAHDALADCLATSRLYAAFMRFMGG
jgi:DNA polymerase III epsilon subunit-like protein